MKIKVLQSISSIDLSVGGPARSLPNMCIETQKYGVDNTIITYKSDNPNNSGLSENNVEVLFVNKEKKPFGKIGRAHV
jgi:hypothetical protein